MLDNKKIDYLEMKNSTGPNNKKSAQVISRLLMDAISPKSVLDIGCGIGIWLNEFKKLKGVEKVQGIDGEWVLNTPLDINRDEIEIYNFESSDSKINCIGNFKYDLAICLEMAEHVSCAKSNFIVDTLIKASDVIYFSAATPRSGGIHHINEKWQTYWIEKFKKRGYVVIDYIRPKIWNDDRVCYFYKEESFVFVHKNALSNYPQLLNYVQEPIYDLIHPVHFMDQVIKPSHEWGYLFEMQKRLLTSIKCKSIEEWKDKIDKWKRYEKNKN